MNEFEELLMMITGIITIGIVVIQIAAVVIAIVCGIMTGVKHSGSFFFGTGLVVLGIRYILSVLNSVPVNMIRAQFLVPETFALFSSISNILTALFDIAVIVLFCMHFVSRYRTGTAHMIAAIALKIISVAVSLGSNMALAGFITKKLPASVFYSVRFLSILAAAAVYIPVIMLFLKAKEKEPVRRKLFVFPLILMIYSVINGVLYTLYSTVVSRSASGSLEMILIMAPLAGAAAVSAGAVYIIKTAGKTGEAAEPT